MSNIFKIFTSAQKTAVLAALVAVPLPATAIIGTGGAPATATDHQTDHEANGFRLRFTWSVVPTEEQTAGAQTVLDNFDWDA